MASIVSAGTTSATALNMSADTSGVLQLASNNGTVALTISTAQVVTFANPPTATGAGSVATNTAYGPSALSSNTTGADNSAFGRTSLAANTTGSQVSGFGSLSLNSNTTGTGNTGIGYAALYLNTTGGTNTAVGYEALRANTTASYNTAVGYQAGLSQTTADYNTFIGYYAGRSTTGDQNTFIGKFAGNAVTSGTLNTIIGAYSGNQGGLDIRTSSNNIVLSDGGGTPRISVSSGGQVQFRSIACELGGTSPSIFRNDNVNASGFHFTIPGAFPTNGTGALNDNVMPLGGGSNRMSVIFAGTGTISTSDVNEKQDIEALSDAETRVAVAIKGLIKKFRWKDAVAAKGDEARTHVGVIAQEIQAAFEAENLDAKKYALFCSDTWHEFNGSSMDSGGNRYTAETEGAIERTRLGVRYDQLLAFVIAAI